MVEFFTEDNGLLDLPTDTALTVTANNPIFDPENADRVFSYPLKLKWTDRNKAALRFAYRADSPIDVLPIGLTMDINGITFEQGVGVIDEDSTEAFQLSFQSNTRAVLTELENIQIDTLLDTIDINQYFQSLWVFDVAVPSSGLPYFISINDVGISVTAVGGDTIPTIIAQLVIAINAQFPLLAALRMNSGVPQLQLSTAEDRPIKLQPWTGGLESLTLQPGYITFGEAQQMNFINYLKDEFATPSVSHRFPPIRNAHFYPVSKTPADWRGILNFLKKDGTDFEIGENVGYEKPDFQYAYVPMVRVEYVLKKITDKLGLNAALFDFDNGEEWNNLLLLNNQSLDEIGEEWRFEVTTAETFKVFINRQKTNINLNNHVPTMTAKDFLSAIAGINLYFVIEDNTLIFRKKNEPFQLGITDLTEKLDVDMTRKRKKREGYTLDYKRDKTETATLAGQLEKLVFGAGGTLVELPFYTLPDIVYSGMKLPLSQQEGSTDFEGIGKKPFTLALLFDRGIQAGESGKQYYQAASGNTDFSDAQNGNFTLAIDGASGIFKQFQEGVIELMDGSTYIAMMRLSAYELANLRKWRTVGKIYLHTETGGILCAIKNIIFKADTHGLGAVVCKVELIAYP